MGLRAFEIAIYKDYSWEIGLRWIDSFENYKDLETNYCFGIAKMTPDNRIAFIADITIDDEIIDESKKDRRFLEVCKFRHKEKEFVGSFIDAFEYIKANWGKAA